MEYCPEERELSCDSCYEISKEYCGAININPGLVPATNYYLNIVDKFAVRHVQEIIVNGNGSFDVDTDVLPDDFFNPYAGKFELYLTTDEDGEDRVDLIFSATDYTCIILTIE